MTATATNDLYSSYKRFVSSRVKHWQPKVYQNLLNMVANATDEATIDAAIRNLDHNMLKPSGIMITLESIYKDAGRVYGSKVYQVVRKQAAKIQARAKAFMPIGYNDELVAEILSYFRLHLLNQAVLPITDTMKEYIHESLIAGQQQGLSLQQVADDIEQTGFPKTRSIVITRTETIRAANFGAMQGARKSGFETEKVWIAARDFRTRRIPRDQFSHINMNGVTIPLDEPFLVPNRNGARDKLMQPGDPHGQAADVIQCRCTVGFNVLTGKDGLPLMPGARPPIQPKPTPIQPRQRQNLRLRLHLHQSQRQDFGRQKPGRKLNRS
jgi:Phage Mu protein F like protein.